MPKRAFIVTPSFEAALLAELGDRPAAHATARASAPAGLLICDEQTGGNDRAGGGLRADRDLVFARQILPAAIEVRASSVSQLAEAAYRAVAGAIDRAPGSFTLHAFTLPTGLDPDDEDGPTTEAAAGLASRAALVGRQLLALLKARRRRAARRYRAPEEAEATFGPSWLLVQLLALDRDRLLVSAAHPRALPEGGTDLAPWPAGAPAIPIDRAPPSRAYQKLEEAFRWLGTEPAAGESCVDLGGAPGGWAFTALRRGARVTAVDRAPLAAPAAGHDNLTTIVGNAFNFEPPHPVDWLLCDVICEPARSIALIDRWLQQGWCQKLVVTVKFKGRDGYGVLSELPPLFARAGWRFARVKQLAHNKNEVTVLGRQRW
jgi:23S rRNA (cytidine2498-2'-O)-methyltransferase